MKTLKFFAIALFICAIGSAVKAAPVNDKLANPYAVLESYVGAVGFGETQDLDQIIDESATFKMTRGKEVLNIGKSEMIDFLNQTQGYKQDCRIRSAIVSSAPGVTVARVDMQYPGFVRSNFVTLTSIDGAWKITNVSSVFN